MPLSRALLLPYSLAGLLRAAPVAVVNVVERSWRGLVDPLADGVIDLTIGALRDEALPGLEQEPRFTDPAPVERGAHHRPDFAQRSAPGLRTVDAREPTCEAAIETRLQEIR